MRRVSPVFTILSITLLFFTSCTTNDNTVKPAEFQVTLTPNVHDSTLTDVFVHNIKKDQSQLFITLPDVEIRHYHPAEFHKGSVYIIRRKDGTPANNNQWRDELWKYTSMKQGKKIFSSQGLDFRVSSHEYFAAIVSDTTLYFVDLQRDKKPVKFTVSEIEEQNVKDMYIQPLAWTERDAFFWGNIFQTVNIHSFFRIAPDTWEVETFDVDSLHITTQDYAFNPTNGVVVFSDFPVIFDAETAKRVRRNKMRVHLYLYDLKTGEKKLLATTHSKNFQPEWLSTRIIEVNNPESKGRIVLSLK